MKARALRWVLGGSTRIGLYTRHDTDSATNATMESSVSSHREGADQGSETLRGKYILRKEDTGRLTPRQQDRSLVKHLLPFPAQPCTKWRDASTKTISSNKYPSEQKRNELAIANNFHNHEARRSWPNGAASGRSSSLAVKVRRTLYWTVATP